MERLIFSNPGAEANEAAIKLARKYGNDKGIQNPTVVVMDNSFHGRTLATLSATGNKKVQLGFEPLVEGFIRVPYNDVAAVAEAAQGHRSEEHTSELQSRGHLVCRLLLEKKKKNNTRV